MMSATATAPASDATTPSAVPTDTGGMLAEILAATKALKAGHDQLRSEVDALGKPQGKAGGAGGPFAAPAVRSGESVLSSRGYSFLRLLGYCGGHLSQDQCKVELELHNRMNKAFTGAGHVKAQNNSIMAPFASEHFPLDTIDSGMVREVRQLSAAGVLGADPEHVSHLRAKHWVGPEGREKAMGWQDGTLGGALVGPPSFGELISILRNNAVFPLAGARMIGLPPTGRITFPRQTGVATSYWVGQSQAIAESQPTTGDLVLQAKKLGVLVKIPNELFHFASVSIEQFVRDDIAQVMALRMDKSLLEAVGSTVEPRGLITYGIQSHTAGTTGADGDTFTPEDVLRMIAKVEERNATFMTWVMRPLMYAYLANLRAGSGFAANDGKGPFLFDMLRGLDQNRGVERGIGSLSGYKVVKSTQASNARVKGNGTANTYILGGDFSDFIIASGGAIEFLTATQGDTMVVNDQTWVRGIHYCDGGVRREASFILCDNLTGY